MEPADREKELLALTSPLYMGLFSGSLLRPGEHVTVAPSFHRDFQELYPTISREDVIDLLEWKNWRPRLVGAYVCGFKGWNEFDERVGNLLVLDELVYASVAYSFALACFASPLSSTALCTYLYNNFSGRCTDYSSICHAIAALKWIDVRNQTDYYEHSIGEWHDKIEAGRATLRGSSGEESRESMRRAISDETVGEAEQQLRALMRLAASL